MPEKMKVHAYRVDPFEQSGTVEELLPIIARDSLADRVLIVGTQQKEVRVEHMHERDGCWFLDFVEFRDDHGPGRASHAAPIEGFEFHEDQKPAAETACMYIPESGHLLVQYNHYGPRAGTIQDYFGGYTQDEAFGFDFYPRLDETTERQFRDGAATRKVTFKVDTRFFNDRDRQAGLPLSHALDLANQSGGQIVEVTIRAGLERSGRLQQRAIRMVNYLLRRHGSDPDFVKKLKVGVKPNVDEKTKTLNLIAHRLELEFNDIPVGEDFRFPRRDRYRALRRAYTGWNRAGIL